LPRPTESFRAPAAAAAVVLLFALCSLSTLTGCLPRAAESEPPETVAGTLYQLQRGRFTRIPDEQTPVRTPFDPWTVQGRISDLVSLRDRVYVGVNGCGIAELDFGGDEPGFRYFYDAMIFRYRTLTTLIPERDSFLCHVYFNKLLNVVEETELKLQGISLLRFLPSTGGYQFLTPPYQEEHPDWEAVGFVPVAEREFCLQWKYSDQNRTLFAYSRFDLSSSEEKEIGELDYRKSYRFQDARQGDSEALSLLLREARARLDVPGASTAYHFHIRSAGEPLIRRYEYHPADFASAEEIHLFSLSAVQEAEHLLLLLPDGSLLHASSESRQIRHSLLPSLPEGFEYRELLLHGTRLVASWEQNAFTKVGSAGIFITEFRLIP
jgi:hypothetical protein